MPAAQGAIRTPTLGRTAIAGHTPTHTHSGTMDARGSPHMHVLGNPRTRRKPTQTWGEHAGSVQQSPGPGASLGGVVCFSHQCYYRMKWHYLSTCCIGPIGSLVRSKNRKVKAALCFQWNVDNNRNIRPRAVWGEMKGDMIKVGHRIKRRWTVLRQFGEKKVKTKSQIFRSGKPWVLMVD